ncbi:BamA/TamA family outer membrane protein [uncultured Shimia sp.]|uniref:BamA/TamA family outer membrane protein n=1 Tax=uncultured Shimia sp. TaxID=573152 RepID=UPI0026208EE7|nr:BamA/TamA family outer membrane protein [uncultured Shimia sp.]
MTAHFATTLKAAARILPGAALAILLSCSTVQADPFANDMMNGSLDDARTQDTPLGFGNGSVVVAPVPFKNVLIGAGLVLGGGYLFNIDEGSDTSILGLGVMRSDNGTNAYGFGGKFVWDENRWQVSASLGQAEGFYDLFVGGTPVPVRQTGDVANLSVLRGLNSDLLFGGSLRYLDTTLGYNSSGTGLPPLPEGHLEVGTVSLLAKWDTRDDDFSARNGHLLDGALTYGQILNSSGRDYSKAVLTYNHYLPIGDQNSIATRFAGCASSEDTPFFDQCSLGGTDGFRGFSPTEFLDDALLSAQAEYRHQLSSRFSGVAFAGFGNTGSSFGRIGDSDVRYAGGLGLRFQLSKKFKAVFSVDMSYNDRKEDLLYIYVGQRF